MDCATLRVQIDTGMWPVFAFTCGGIVEYCASQSATPSTIFTHNGMGCELSVDAVKFL